MQKQKQNIKLDIRTNKLIQKNPTQFQIRASFIAMVSQIIQLCIISENNQFCECFSAF